MPYPIIYLSSSNNPRKNWTKLEAPPHPTFFFFSTVEPNEISLCQWSTLQSVWQMTTISVASKFSTNSFRVMWSYFPAFLTILRASRSEILWRVSVLYMFTIVSILLPLASYWANCGYLNIKHFSKYFRNFSFLNNLVSKIKGVYILLWHSADVILIILTQYTCQIAFILRLPRLFFEPDRIFWNSFAIWSSLQDFLNVNVNIKELNIFKNNIYIYSILQSSKYGVGNNSVWTIKLFKIRIFKYSW